MAEKACLKRLQKEYRALCKEPVSNVVARPLPNDILEWHSVKWGIRTSSTIGVFLKLNMSGQYTIKSDVYSFGVVMLELLTGRTPFDSTRPRSEQSLVRWATPQYHDINALSKMVDPALKSLYPVKSLSRFADVIALCIQPEPEFRPPMSEVVQALVRLVQRANMSKRTFGNDDAARAGSGDADDYTP